MLKQFMSHFIKTDENPRQKKRRKLNDSAEIEQSNDSDELPSDLLDVLPDEVLAEIFKFIPANQFFTLSLTNRRFANIIKYMSDQGYFPAEEGNHIEEETDSKYLKNEWRYSGESADPIPFEFASKWLLHTITKDTYAISYAKENDDKAPESVELTDKEKFEHTFTTSWSRRLFSHFVNCGSETSSIFAPNATQQLHYTYFYRGAEFIYKMRQHCGPFFDETRYFNEEKEEVSVTHLPAIAKKDIKNIPEGTTRSGKSFRNL